MTDDVWRLIPPRRQRHPGNIEMTSTGAQVAHSADDEDVRPAPKAQEFRSAWNRVRLRLIEGLIVILPVAVTFWIIHWLYSWIENYVIEPLAGIVLFKGRTLSGSPELPAWFESYVAPVIAIAIAVAIVYCCGVLAHSRLHRLIEQLLLRVPIVAPIYDAVRSVVKCLQGSNDRPTPQRVVLVSFPHPGMRLPAIVTSVCKDVTTERTLLCVYVPTTPVPTSGFFLMVPEEDVTELNWDIQQTLQAIISGGLTAPADVTYFGAPQPPATALHPPVPEALAPAGEGERN